MIFGVEDDGDVVLSLLWRSAQGFCQPVRVFRVLLHDHVKFFVGVDSCFAGVGLAPSSWVVEGA